ncbi:spermidine/putrescine ABC transporter ATP-binding protein [Microterricola pindariensis]|uniref:Spermidine/putrescine ABC transporter ATP-binding protein n=1 Tax=Microterricola pindariensis TaxID=478010 RepID=A0ABX5AYW5_9MICO|nr:spermidine/putrescine ABC transporter ATP-binding protein [Microterricola pindariensis]
MRASAQQAPSVSDSPRSLPGTVTLRQVAKRFGEFSAVEQLDLEVQPGEFLSMLGPSGSGKTTVLRMIAGFETVTSGSIHLSGTDVTQTPPHSRPVNTVFQDYALFPHLTIAENVGYGLRVGGTNRTDREAQVRASLEQVRLSAVADRLPHQLSGGQRQRIALARALIMRPQVLLLDEPLGALDKQLREEMQIELKQIQREVGITFIFVTHDQEEALTLSDRVAVFNNGRIEQIGSAREVYEFPKTEFVARFLGLSNLIRGTEPGAELVSVRPERVRLSAADTAAAPGETSFLGTVAEAVYTGPTTRFLVDTEDGQRLTAERANDHHPSAETAFGRGDRVRVGWTADHATRVA